MNEQDMPPPERIYVGGNDPLTLVCTHLAGITGWTLVFREGPPNFWRLLPVRM